MSQILDVENHKVHQVDGIMYVDIRQFPLSNVRCRNEIYVNSFPFRLNRHTNNHAMRALGSRGLFLGGDRGSAVFIPDAAIAASPAF